MAKIRVLIADDHAIVRMGLVALMSAESDIEVVGESKNGVEAIRESLRLKPDIVIMDILMPRKDGIAATKELREKLPDTKVLVLTSVGTSNDISRAMAAGASGAILKNADNGNIIDAIRNIVAGKQVLSREVRKLMKDEPPIPALSPRQQDILASLTRGLTNNDISKQLGISIPSVKTHLVALFSKLGAANKAEAVAIALRKHLLWRQKVEVESGAVRARTAEDKPAA